MNTYRYHTIIAVPALLLIFLSGCLPEAPVVPKRMSMDFLVEGMGDENDEFTSNGDTLTVSEIKLYLNSFILDTQGEARLQANEGIILFYERRNGGVKVEQFAADFGYDNFNTFTGFEFFITTPPDSITVPDRDLVTQDGERFSIVLKGSYNDSSFVYKSDAELNRLVDFDSVVEIGSNEETLKINIISAIGDIMVDPQTGRILSPIDPADAEQIDSMIEQSIRVEATSESVITGN